MKIFSLMTPIKFGGGEKLMIDYGLFFKSKNIEFLIINFTKSEEFEELLRENEIRFYTLTKIKLKESPLKRDYLFLFFKLLPFCFRLRKIIFQNNPDFVFVNGFPTIVLFPPSLIFRKYDFKKIYFHHSLKSKEKGLIRKIYLSVLKKYDLIIGVSSLTEKTLKEVFPEIKEKIISLPNVINCKRFDIQVSKEELRKKLNLPDGILGICVGRLVKFKNQKFLINVVENIDFEEFKIIVIGYGEEYENLKKMIEDKNLEKRIILLGYKNNKDIPFYLKASDIFIYPSLKEGFGIVILEAMASGLPVVIFKNIYVKEFGENILVAENEEEFIEMIKKIIKDENLRKEIGKRVQEDVKNFEIEIIGNRLLEILLTKNKLT